MSYLVWIPRPMPKNSNLLTIRWLKSITQTRQEMRLSLSRSSRISRMHTRCLWTRPSVRSMITCAPRQRTLEAKATVARSLSPRKEATVLDAVVLTSKTISSTETLRPKTTFTIFTQALRGRTAINKLVAESASIQRMALQRTFIEPLVGPKDQSDKDSKHMTNTSSNRRIKGDNTRKMIPLMDSRILTRSERRAEVSVPRTTTRNGVARPTQQRRQRIMHAGNMKTG